MSSNLPKPLDDFLLLLSDILFIFYFFTSEVKHVLGSVGLDGRISGFEEWNEEFARAKPLMYYIHIIYVSNSSIKISSGSNKLVLAKTTKTTGNVLKDLCVCVCLCVRISVNA